MRRVLAAAVLVAFMPTAHAQDKGKADFAHNAEFRARFFWMQNPGAKKETVNQRSSFEHRFKLGMTYKANEKVSATATLIHNSMWGSQGTADFDSTTGGTEQNFMAVNEAFLNWGVSDDVHLKLGRFNYQMGDGYVIAANDWEMTPTSFEGLMLGYEAEFGKFQVFNFKHRDENPTTPSTNGSHDPEDNSYGLNFDLKSKPEMLKSVNAHLIKRTAQGSTTSTGGATDDDTQMRYGANASLVFGPVDATAWLAMHSGKTRAVGAATVAHDTAGSMMQADVGFNMPAMMTSRFHVRYHKDSGTKASSDAATTKTEAYDPFFSEKHDSAGAMDLFGWGNLTFTQVGWTGKPMDKLEVGVNYTMLSRTEKGLKTGTGTMDASTFRAGKYGGDLPSTANDKGKLGDEIDVWATHHYDNNLSATARLGQFAPGEYFKDTATNNVKDSILQAMIEVRATF